MILKYLKSKEWTLIAVCIGLIAGQVFLDLRIPDYMSDITGLLTTGGTVDQIMNVGWPMLGCALGSLALAVVTGYIAAYVATSLSWRLRKIQFDRVESFSMGEINKFSTASLITRSTNDITQIQMAVAMGLQVMIKAPILAVWAITKIADKNIEWTIITAIAVMLMMLVIGTVLIFVIPKFKKIQWMTDDVNRVTRESLQGIRVTRAYNAEDYQESKFEKANSSLTSANLFTNRAMAIMMPAMTTIMSMLTLGIYWVGAIMIHGNPGSFKLFSDMIVFTSYAMQVVMAFMMLIIVFMILPRAMVSAKRIEDVINTQPTILDGPVTESPKGVEGSIVFDDVCFKYPAASDYVLKNLSFEVKKGETVAFIGSTGSGKSTLINLIPRFYDVTGGKVLVDGIDVRDYNQDALHQKIGYVSQKAVMFSGTVASNVSYGENGKPVTEDDIMRAVAIAQGSEFVDMMEEKYDSLVAQGGTNLSGGQKQRLSIARAIHSEPEIYIFDDSFSALDYKTDRALRTELKKKTAGVTSLIVAQRIGTIIEADKIIVLDDGCVVGMGKHADLLRTCPTYREIASSQLSDEELGL